MTDLNGAGGGALGGLTGTGAGQLQWWHLALDRPLILNVEPSTAPVLSVIATTWDNGTVPVRVQVSTSSTFTTTVFDSVITTAAGDGSTVSSIQASSLVDGTVYYWRARPEPASGETLGWTPTRQFRVLLRSGDARETVYENVGVEITIDRDDTSAETVYENVGVQNTLDRDVTSVETIYENVGFLGTRDPDAVDTVYEGDVNTDTPTPMLWYLVPGAGRAGDGIQIIGFGFGDLQSTFSGLVEIDYGTPLGWVTVPVVSWQTFPANNAAYTEDRRMSEVPEGRVAVFFDDHFDTDGAIGAPWISIGGVWTASGSEVGPTSGSGRRLAVVDALADGTLHVTLGSANAKIALRVVDADNLLYFDPASKVLRQIVAGTDSAIGTAMSGTAGVAGDTYTFLMAGTSISVSKNGVSIGSATSSTFQTEDRHGMLANAGTELFREVVWDSGIDPQALVDMQHTVIEITVPSDAVPPGYPLRVRTDGP